MLNLTGKHLVNDVLQLTDFSLFLSKFCVSAITKPLSTTLSQLLLQILESPLDFKHPSGGWSSHTNYHLEHLFKGNFKPQSYAVIWYECDIYVFSNVTPSKSLFLLTFVTSNIASLRHLQIIQHHINRKFKPTFQNILY